MHCRYLSNEEKNESYMYENIMCTRLAYLFKCIIHIGYILLYIILLLLYKVMRGLSAVDVQLCRYI